MSSKRNQTCTVLVLNYNGKHLLAKNLPAVIKAAWNTKCLLAVADNGSTDNSIEFLKSQFPEVRVIALTRNYGFGEGNNRAVKMVRTDLVILLNNDIVPQPYAFIPLIKHFQDPSAFAVSCHQLVKTKNGNFSGGHAKAEFSRGLLRHRPFPKTPVKPSFQLFASGGASAFDRQKFLALGGFDLLYAPFYWEDADLSAKAWARDDKVIFEPNSLVEHRHETTIKGLYPPWYIKAIADRNLFIFNWRHLNGFKFWMLHILWLPVHIVRRPLGFLLGFLAIAAIVSRRIESPYRLDIKKLI